MKKMSGYGVGRMDNRNTQAHRWMQTVAARSLAMGVVCHVVYRRHEQIGGLPASDVDQTVARLVRTRTKQTCIDKAFLGHHMILGLVPHLQHFGKLGAGDLKWINEPDLIYTVIWHAINPSLQVTQRAFHIMHSG